MSKYYVEDCENEAVYVAQIQANDGVQPIFACEEHAASFRAGKCLRDLETGELNDPQDLKRLTTYLGSGEILMDPLD